MPTKEEVAEMLAQYQYEVGRRYSSSSTVLLSDAERMIQKTPVTVLIVGATKTSDRHRLSVSCLSNVKARSRKKAGCTRIQSAVVITPEEFKRSPKQARSSSACLAMDNRPAD